MLCFVCRWNCSSAQTVLATRSTASLGDTLLDQPLPDPADQVVVDLARINMPRPARVSPVHPTDCGPSREPRADPDSARQPPPDIDPRRHRHPRTGRAARSLAVGTHAQPGRCGSPRAAGRAHRGRPVADQRRLWGAAGAGAAARDHELFHELDDHVRDFLADHNIHDEPPTWHPPTELFDDLRLPGANPAEADIDRLHQLIRVEDRTIRETAETLGTTRDILRRHLLERNPAPLGAQSTAYQSTAYLKAKAALAPDTLADLYLRERLSIAEIAVRIDVDATALTHLARDYQIPSRKPGRPATTNIDRDLRLPLESGHQNSCRECERSRCGHSSFELDRGQIAQRGMTPPPVIVRQPLEQLQTRSSFRCRSPAV
ncbi:LysR family transcriptional regulator [Nocardia farcinica]|nr:LysR family transcriptional regulator [Nocardia farcinica]